MSHHEPYPKFNILPPLESANSNLQTPGSGNRTSANMSGKGAKGLSGKGAKGTMGDKGKAGDKKKPVSRSARAGLQFPVGRIHRLLKANYRLSTHASMADNPSFEFCQHYLQTFPVLWSGRRSASFSHNVLGSPPTKKRAFYVHGCSSLRGNNVIRLLDVPTGSRVSEWTSRCHICCLQCSNLG